MTNGFCQRACSASQGNHWVDKGVYTMGSNLLVRERARLFPSIQQWKLDAHRMSALKSFTFVVQCTCHFFTLFLFSLRHISDLHLLRYFSPIIGRRIVSFLLVNAYLIIFKCMKKSSQVSVKSFLMQTL
ncbi:hypothetical protein DM01DRAFT_1097852 [Hesseltinella vesiculosa]|uniref:Uncharacterized protein n=1 Tax=Hesseltinella vesiculosa TaxID=101127 RepID=A0A1X2GBQ6_9FUNG|nr:hypothetical protein DM01DRAFT_1097852 [Hesseltinella vesiculosa]